MSINYLPCRRHHCRHRRCHPHHRLWHHPRCHRCPTTHLRPTHSTMNKSMVEAVRAVLAPVSNWLSSSNIRRPSKGRPCQGASCCRITLATCPSCGGAADALHLSDGAGSASTVSQSIGASTIVVQPAAGRRNKLHTRVAYMPTDYEASSHARFVWQKLGHCKID